MGVVRYNPRGAGVLTGKYKRGEEPPAESRFAQGDYGRMYQGRYWNDLMFDVAGAVVELAREEGCTPAQLAVAWLSGRATFLRSEEHTSELQSPDHLVCRLLLEKKKDI